MFHVNLPAHIRTGFTLDTVCLGCRASTTSLASEDVAAFVEEHRACGPTPPAYTVDHSADISKAPTGDRGVLRSGKGES